MRTEVPHPAPAEPAAPVRRRARQEQDALFRPTLVKVLLVQVVTLILLWLLQATYHG